MIETMLLSMTGSETLLKQIVMFKIEQCMKELKVGERIILEVVEATSFSCQGCFFAKEGYACPDYCYTRLDGTNVIFKEVKE